MLVVQRLAHVPTFVWSEQKRHRWHVPLGVSRTEKKFAKRFYGSILLLAVLRVGRPGGRRFAELKFNRFSMRSRATISSVRLGDSRRDIGVMVSAP